MTWQKEIRELLERRNLLPSGAKRIEKAEMARVLPRLESTFGSCIKCREVTFTIRGSGDGERFWGCCICRKKASAWGSGAVGCC